MPIDVTYHYQWQGMLNEGKGSVQINSSLS